MYWYGAPFYHDAAKPPVKLYRYDKRDELYDLLYESVTSVLHTSQPMASLFEKMWEHPPGTRNKAGRAKCFERRGANHKREERTSEKISRVI